MESGKMSKVSIKTACKETTGSGSLDYTLATKPGDDIDVKLIEPIKPGEVRSPSDVSDLLKKFQNLTLYIDTLMVKYPEYYDGIESVRILIDKMIKYMSNAELTVSVEEVTSAHDRIVDLIREFECNVARVHPTVDFSGVRPNASRCLEVLRDSIGEIRAEVKKRERLYKLVEGMDAETDPASMLKALFSCLTRVVIDDEKKSEKFGELFKPVWVEAVRAVDAMFDGDVNVLVDFIQMIFSSDSKQSAK